LFLDEIGELELDLQPKLLRALERREIQRLGGEKTTSVDVRIIAATNRDLRAMVARGEFREDLYYRLNVVSIQVPPLRERREDIIPLARHFIDESAADLKKDVRGIDPGGVRVLKRYSWPGNIRELKNCLERAVLMCEMSFIREEDLSLRTEYDGTGSGAAQLRLPPDGIQLDELEKQAILEALRINSWIQKDAARFLGISSRVMNYKVAKYEIKNPRWSKNKLVV